VMNIHKSHLTLLSQLMMEFEFHAYFFNRWRTFKIGKVSGIPGINSQRWGDCPARNPFTDWHWDRKKLKAKCGMPMEVT
jgi:hypothetical protein